MARLTRRKFIKQSGRVTLVSAWPFSWGAFSIDKPMTDNKILDAIIVGGSYSGLSAGMALGRSLRNVLIIDSGTPCNRQTPHSHNFITQDGKTPTEISTVARQQVEQYETINFYNGLVVQAQQTEVGFTITTQENETFEAKKLIFATGIRDIMPDIPGFAECWGISVIHCPYCHGYEVRSQPTGILDNGDAAFHYAKLISNWTDDLTIVTNGKATFTPAQLQQIEKHKIPIIEKEIASLEHHHGKLQEIMFVDGTTLQLSAIYSSPEREQHCSIPQQLGCELTEQGLLKVDMFQKTTVEGVLACGDNASPLRAVSHAVATGNIAGVMVNKDLIEEEF